MRMAFLDCRTKSRIRRKRKAAVIILKTGRFDHRFSCHHQQCKQGSTKLILVLYCITYIAVMMTAESILSKQTVSGIAAALFFSP